MNFSAARYALVIPALNEADLIGLLVARIPHYLFEQVVVVGNGSEDSTGETARAAGEWRQFLEAPLPA